MRLGGPLSGCKTPEDVAAKARLLGYRAVYVHTELAVDAETRKAYLQMLRENELVPAEVGAWSNPISPLPQQRRDALDLCQKNLAIAEDVGARCCVNICGSRGLVWDGPHAANLTRETFDMVVESVRQIIDAVKPTRTFYTLETMPWMYPDSPESYLALIKAVDRKSFGVHFDPVNLVNSPQRIFANAELIKEFVAKLGPYIRSVHCKDIKLADKLTVHLDECRPGTGSLDYAMLLREVSRLEPDLPLMMEHLPDEEYPLAAKYLRTVASSVGVEL